MDFYPLNYVYISQWPVSYSLNPPLPASQSSPFPKRPTGSYPGGGSEASPPTWGGNSGFNNWVNSDEDPVLPPNVTIVLVLFFGVCAVIVRYIYLDNYLSSNFKNNLNC
uniref:Uncharacterized protein n=1 Tax=Chlorodesmis fastigiata TaxID=189431 RepID=A0A2P0QHG9_CHLFS|nr:hypothetical protein [Chlorodesmis fastigiata]ARO74213.1 hypothetical protein [Chlorodesmis fastigiata]